MATAVLYGVLALTLLVVLWFLWRRGPKEGFQSCVPKYQKPLVLTFPGNPDPQVEDISVAGSPSSAQVPQSIQTLRASAAKIYRIPSSLFQGYDTLGYLLVNGGGSTTSGAFLKSWSGSDAVSRYIRAPDINHASVAKTDGVDPIKLDGGKDVFVYVGIPDKPTGLQHGDGVTISPQGTGTGNGPVGLSGSGAASATNFTGAPNKNGYALLVFYNETYFPQFTFESNLAPTNVTETSTTVSVQFTAKGFDSGKAKGILKVREQGKDEKTVVCTVVQSGTNWECKASLTDLSPGTKYTYNFNITYTVNGQEFIQTSDALSFRTRDTLSFDQVVITSLLFDKVSFRLPFRATAQASVSAFEYRLGNSGSFTNLIGPSGGPSGTVQIVGNDCSGSIVGLQANTNYDIRVTLNIGSTSFTPAVFNVRTPHNLVFGTSTPTTSDVGPVNATIGLSNITASGVPTVDILYKTAADAGYTTVTAGTGMSSTNSSFTGKLTGLSTLTRYSVKLRFTLGNIVRETSDVSFTTLDHSVTFETPTWTQQSGSFTAGSITFPFTSSSPNFDSAVLLRIWKTAAGIGTAVIRQGTVTGDVASGYVFTTSLTGLSQNQQYTYQLEVRLRESTTLFKSPLTFSSSLPSLSPSPSPSQSTTQSSVFEIKRDVFVISHDTVTPTTAIVRVSYNSGSYQDIQSASVGVKVGVSGSSTMTSYPGTVVTLTGLQPETKYVYTPFLTSGGTTFESLTQKGEFTTLAHTLTFLQTAPTLTDVIVGSTIKVLASLQSSASPREIVGKFILTLDGSPTEFPISAVDIKQVGSNITVERIFQVTELYPNTNYSIKMVMEIGTRTFTSQDYNIRYDRSVFNAAQGSVTATTAAFNVTYNPYTFNKAQSVSDIGIEYRAGTTGTFTRVSGTSIRITELQPTTNYQWRAVADAGDSSVTSDIFSFQTRGIEFNLTSATFQHVPNTLTGTFRVAFSYSEPIDTLTNVRVEYQGVGSWVDRSVQSVSGQVALQGNTFVFTSNPITIVPNTTYTFSFNAKLGTLALQRIPSSNQFSLFVPMFSVSDIDRNHNFVRLKVVYNPNTYQNMPSNVMSVAIEIRKSGASPEYITHESDGFMYLTTISGVQIFPSAYVEPNGPRIYGDEISGLSFEVDPVFPYMEITSNVMSGGITGPNNVRIRTMLSEYYNKTSTNANDFQYDAIEFSDNTSIDLKIKTANVVMNAFTLGQPNMVYIFKIRVWRFSTGQTIKSAKWYMVRTSSSPAFYWVTGEKIGFSRPLTYYVSSTDTNVTMRFGFLCDVIMDSSKIQSLSTNFTLNTNPVTTRTPTFDTVTNILSTPSAQTIALAYDTNFTFQFSMGPFTSPVIRFKVVKHERHISIIRYTANSASIVLILTGSTLNWTQNGIRMSGRDDIIGTASSQPFQLAGFHRIVDLQGLTPNTTYSFNPFYEYSYLNSSFTATIKEVYNDPVQGSFTTLSSSEGFSNNKTSKYIPTFTQTVQPLFKFGASLREVFGI